MVLSALLLPLSVAAVSPQAGQAPSAETSVFADLSRSLLAQTASATMQLEGSDRYIADPTGHRIAERGGRVVASRLPQVQPRFAAGRLAAEAGVIGRTRMPGDREMRTALAGPQAIDRYTLEASLFRRSGTDLGDTSLETAVAELKPSVADAPRRGKTEPASVPAAELQVAAAYAPAEESRAASLFDSVLGRAPGGFVPPIGKKDHAWAASVLPPSSFSDKEQLCLANGIYFEARGESELGQAAVAQVILNRVRNPTYPKTICGVVYQNKDWRNRCQFSFACDGIPDRIWNRPAFETAKRIAHEVTIGETWLPEVGSATHYHATYVNPRWAKTMQKVDKIGLHVFYRTFGGGWR